MSGGKGRESGRRGKRRERGAAVKLPIAADGRARREEEEEEEEEEEKGGEEGGRRSNSASLPPNIQYSALAGDLT